MVSLDVGWAREVCRRCDPVFAAADVGYERSGELRGPSSRAVESLLWEADPERFAARYPDSGVVETYGVEPWDGVHCVDYWLYLEAEQGRCRLGVEGWDLPDLYIEVTGSALLDAHHIAAVLARILGVTVPT